MRTVIKNGGTVSMSTEGPRELFLQALRLNRDELLQKSDWRTTRDYPGSDQQQWLEYRQDLRDLPSLYIQGEDLIFPTKPGG